MINKELYIMTVICNSPLGSGLTAIFKHALPSLVGISASHPFESKLHDPTRHLRNEKCSDVHDYEEGTGGYRKDVFGFPKNMFWWVVSFIGNRGKKNNKSGYSQNYDKDSNDTFWFGGYKNFEDEKECHVN